MIGNIAASRKFAFRLFVVVVLLTVAGAAVQVIKHYRITFPLVGTFLEVFDLDGEGNIPAWSNSVLLALAGVILGIIAMNRKAVRARYAGHWLALAVLFILLSMDEIVALHERLTHTISRHFTIGGFFRFLWVIPGMAFAAAVGLLYLPFLFHLPRWTRNWIILSTVMYLGGALGVEMCSGYARVTFGLRSVHYWAAVVVEEFLEMSGLVAFIYALLGHASRYLGNYVTPQQPTPPLRTARGR